MLLYVLRVRVRAHACGACAQISVGFVLVFLMYILRRRTAAAQVEAANASAQNMHEHIMQYICHELR